MNALNIVLSMRKQLLTIIWLMATLSGFSQPLGPYFHSRLEFQLLSPDIIKKNNITRVKISDHFMEKISFNYEFQYNPEGIITRVLFNPDLNKSEICNFDPADTIFYNRTTINVINGNNRTTRIKYDQKGRIETVTYSHNQIIIGCPVRSLKFEYDSSGRISGETMTNCTDSLVSRYVYHRKVIKEIICTNFRKKEGIPWSAVETINERFNVNYDSSGLLKSIIKSSDPEVFVSYEYIK